MVWMRSGLGDGQALLLLWELVWDPLCWCVVGRGLNPEVCVSGMCSVFMPSLGQPGQGPGLIPGHGAQWPRLLLAPHSNVGSH